MEDRGLLHVREALEEVGYGPYQRWLLFLCSFFRASESVQLMMVTYLAVALAADPLWALSPVHRGILVAVVNLGALLGGAFWGMLSDRFGRTKTYFVSAGSATAFAVAVGYATNFSSLVILQFCLGVSLSGNTCCTALLSEFLPSQHRGRAIVALQASKIVGHLIAVVLAWWTLRYYDWRVYAFACSVFLGISTAIYFLLLESPRYLMLHNRHAEAFEILDKVSKVNGTALSTRFSGMAVSNDVVHNDMFGSLKAIFGRRGRYTTLVLMGLWISAFAVFYGLIVVTPAFFAVTGSPYLKSGIASFAEVVGFVITAALIDHSRRILMLNLNLGMLALLLFILCFLPSNLIAGSIILCVSRMFSISAVFVLYVYCAEFYPTSSRNSALGLLVGLSKIGNIVSAIVGEYESARIYTPFFATMAMAAFLLSLQIFIETNELTLNDSSNSPRRKISGAYFAETELETPNLPESEMTESRTASIS